MPCRGPFRKSAIPLGLLAVLAAIAVLTLLGQEWARWRTDSRSEEKKAATELMRRAMQAVKAEKLRLGIPIDRSFDPNGTGLIGAAYSDMTTTRGSLVSKKISTDPAFAAALVEMLDRAGARPGDGVAISFSGSFPALNIAVLAAVKALNLRPVIISSEGASMYGANQPGMTWLDMERILFEKGLVPCRSLAASLGGIAEAQGGLDGTGIAEGLAAIRRNGIPLLQESGGPGLGADIQRRMALFDRALGGRRPAAFINVGGSLTSLGSGPAGRRLRPGLLERLPPSHHPERGVIFRMAEQGVPVIHLLKIKSLAVRYGIPVEPLPPGAMGTGGTASRGRYSVPLAVAGLVLLMGSLFVLKAVPRRPAGGVCGPGLRPSESERGMEKG